MNLFNKHATFRSKKNHSKGTKRYELHKYAKSTLGSVDIESAVRLPQGEDLNEWLATNTIDFYNEVSLVYGTINEFCREETCPMMSAGSKFEYLWKDGKEYKVPVRKSAPAYINLLMTWIEDQVNDEHVFPSDPHTPYPKGFLPLLRDIYRRLFRVYAHIYYSHFDQIISLGAEAHINSCYKHFILFVLQFQLIDEKEIVPLKELTQNLLKK